MLLHSSFFSPSSGISTSCTESRPPPMQLHHSDCRHGVSLGSPPAFVITGASFESPPLPFYKPFILTGASSGSPPRLSTSHLLLQLLHSEVHLGSLRAILRYWRFTWKSTVILGTSLGSTHPRLSMIHIRHCWRKNLSRKCFIWRHSTFYGLCTWHSPSGVFMALPEPFIEVVERTHDSIVAHTNI